MAGLAVPDESVSADLQSRMSLNSVQGGWLSKSLTRVGAGVVGFMNSSEEKDFQHEFSGILPPNERLLDAFKADYVTASEVFHGHIYVSASFMCFCAKPGLFSSENKRHIVLPFRDMKTIVPCLMQERDHRVHFTRFDPFADALEEPTAVVAVISDTLQFAFTSLYSYDRVLQVLRSLARRHITSMNSDAVNQGWERLNQYEFIERAGKQARGGPSGKEHAGNAEHAVRTGNADILDDFGYSGRGNDTDRLQKVRELEEDLRYFKSQNALLEDQLTQMQEKLEDAMNQVDRERQELMEKITVAMSAPGGETDHEGFESEDEIASHPGSPAEPGKKKKLFGKKKKKAAAEEKQRTGTERDPALSAENAQDEVKRDSASKRGSGLRKDMMIEQLREDLDRSQDKLKKAMARMFLMSAQMRKEERRTFVIALDQAISQIKGTVIFLTIRNLPFISRDIKKIDAKRDKEGLFKEAHMDIKKIVVEIRGEQGVGREWDIETTDIEALKPFQHKIVYKSLQQLVISYDNMVEETRRHLTTAEEIIANRVWLLHMAKCSRDAVLRMEHNQEGTPVSL